MEKSLVDCGYNWSQSFQCGKMHSCIGASEFLLTKGVVDDLKQGKVAGCYTVHP